MPSGTKNRGFASMDAEKQKEIARMFRHRPLALLTLNLLMGIFLQPDPTLSPSPESISQVPSQPKWRASTRAV